MKFYRFSPIHDEAGCLEALEHIETKLRELSGLVLEEKLPINTLKIFAHYKEEHDFLRQWVAALGKSDDDGSVTSNYVKPSEPMTINGDPIVYVGIRVPDPYRSQVGCGDFVVKDFEEFRSKYLGKSDFIREAQHPKYQMLELFHPDIDVLGYVVKA